MLVYPCFPSAIHKRQPWSQVPVSQNSCCNACPGPDLRKRKTRVETLGKPVRNRKSRGKSSWKWRMLVVCLALWWPEMAWNGWMDPQGLPQDGTCCKPPQSAIDLSGVWKMCFFLHLDMGINMSFMQNVGWYLISKRIWTMISVFNITIH